MSGFMWFFLFVILLILTAIITASLVMAHVSPGGETPAAPASETYVAYDTPDFSDSAGFRFVSLPTDEVLSAPRFWLVNGTNAQTEYNVAPGHALTLRTAKTGELLIPDAYTQAKYDSTADYDIDGVTVTHRASPGQKALLTWSKDGFDYALYAPEPEMNLMGGLIDDFVEQAVAKAV